MKFCRTKLVASLVVAAMAFAIPAQAATALPNGDFETGDLTGWSTAAQGPGAWFAYSGGPMHSDPRPIFGPPQGTYEAITDEDPPGGAFVLFTTFDVPKSKTELAFTFWWINRYRRWCSTGNVNFGPKRCNQMFTIDILPKDASPFTLHQPTILKHIAGSAAHTPLRRGPHTVTAGLNELQGRTVMLRFLQIDNNFFMHLGVDEVRLR